MLPRSNEYEIEASVTTKRKKEHCILQFLGEAYFTTTFHIIYERIQSLLKERMNTAFYIMYERLQSILEERKNTEVVRIPRGRTILPPRILSQ